ncbi:MAG: hypothetical protein KU28_00745 [Sulfurovum sp. PC08-66]|nr:MAG: hypothetical protein KU28_00745 [Sulfurovum sp. PC08-66]KIM12494.1 MAG: hypothetical protein KU37_00860 [Sulfuricurvum sp. PC08-66]
MKKVLLTLSLMVLAASQLVAQEEQIQSKTQTKVQAKEQQEARKEAQIRNMNASQISDLATQQQNQNRVQQNQEIRGQNAARGQAKPEGMGK